MRAASPYRTLVPMTGRPRFARIARLKPILCGLLALSLVSVGPPASAVIDDSPIEPGVFSVPEATDTEGLEYEESSEVRTSSDLRFGTVVDFYRGPLPYTRNHPKGTRIRVFDSVLKEMRTVPSTDGLLFNGNSFSATTSDDGRYVTFTSEASNVVHGGVAHRHIYQADLWTGVTEIVTLDEFGNHDDDAVEPGIRFAVTPDGTYVVYYIRGDLLRDDDLSSQVYRRNMRTGELVFVSQDQIGNSPGTSVWPRVSDDGRYVAFFGNAGSNLERPYWRDVDTGELVMIATGPDGPIPGKVLSLQVSPDGRTVEFRIAEVIEDIKSYTWNADVGYAVETADYEPPLDPVTPIGNRDSLSDGCGGDDLRYPAFARPLDDEVVRLYNAAFGRLPDSGGQNYWIDTRASGATQLAVAAEFSVSAEWDIRFGDSPTNEQIVDRFYANILDRLPDPEGRAYWLGLVQSGQITIPQLLVQFADSQENINRTQTTIVQTREDGAICRLYLTLLQQKPDSAALQHWRTQLLAGTTLSEIADVLLATDRFDRLYDSGSTSFELVNQISLAVVGDTSGRALFVRTWLTELEAKQLTEAQLMTAISQGSAAVRMSGTTPPR